MEPCLHRRDDSIDVALKRAGILPAARQKTVDLYVVSLDRLPQSRVDSEDGGVVLPKHLNVVRS